MAASYFAGNVNGQVVSVSRETNAIDLPPPQAEPMGPQLIHAEQGVVG